MIMNSDLNQSILKFTDSLTAGEKKILKGRLTQSVPLFFDKNNQRCFSEKYSSKNFNQLAAILRTLSPNHNYIPKNGIVYRGFPDWLNNDLLLKLQQEAKIRRLEPLDRHDHFLGCGGDYADKLSVDNNLVKFVEQQTGRTIKATGIASYLFYDSPGLGIRPHVDTDIFSINLMVMLRHEFKDENSRSATLVFPENGEIEKYQLSVGEAMLMYGGAVVHSRSLISEGENVCLLTIGFNVDEGPL